MVFVVSSSIVRSHKIAKRLKNAKRDLKLGDKRAQERKRHAEAAPTV
jgi:hypothetical protein